MKITKRRDRKAISSNSMNKYAVKLIGNRQSTARPLSPLRSTVKILRADADDLSLIIKCREEG